MRIIVVHKQKIAFFDNLALLHIIFIFFTVWDKALRVFRSLMYDRAFYLIALLSSFFQREIKLCASSDHLNLFPELSDFSSSWLFGFSPLFPIKVERFFYQTHLRSFGFSPLYFTRLGSFLSINLVSSSLSP